MSEGPALWIALTWPRGLESLLKAKARLWALMSSALVAAVLLYAAWLCPENWWKIVLVGLGWFLFARSLAEKTVTVATADHSIRRDRPNFVGHALGCLARDHDLRHWRADAAMGSRRGGRRLFDPDGCGNVAEFSGRLPYLYDPWSEPLPPAPSLMHAMIAISALVEGGAVLLGAVLIWSGRQNLAVAQGLIFGLGGVAVSLIMVNFLRKRGVKLADVWLWRDGDNDPASGLWRPLSARGFRDSRFPCSRLPSSAPRWAPSGCAIWRCCIGFPPRRRC